MQAAGRPPVVAGRANRFRRLNRSEDRWLVCDEISDRQAGPRGHKEASENIGRGRPKTSQSSLK